MEEADIDASVRPWGNSLGIIIPAEIARQLHLRPGESVQVNLRHTPARNSADALPKWNFVTDVDIDAILDEEFGA